jgi:hypothetical protein
MDIIKECRQCHEKKPRTSEYFYRQGANRDGLDARCKACDNKRSQARKDERYRAIKDKPCVDCQGTFGYYAMCLDHRDGLDKTINLSQAGSYSHERFYAEAAKCDVVCLNCHAKRTWERKHS